MAISNILRTIKRYWAITFFPTFVTLAIYADWNHTKQWKKKLAEQGKQQLNN